MLFMLNGIAKLKDEGVMVIVQDASPLYKGKPESGEDKIRSYILENDWLDAIIRLSGDAFYNTGLVTFLWVINKGKPEKRAGKVQLIDASGCCVPRNRPIGKKRNDITKFCRDLVLEAFSDFETKDYSSSSESGNAIHVRSLVCDAADFGYNRVGVCEPCLTLMGQLWSIRKGAGC